MFTLITKSVLSANGMATYSHASAPRRICSRPMLMYIIQVHVVSKRALQLSKLIQIYLEDMYSVLKCHNVAEHTEFYLG
jgi:hypothetical protein